MVNEEKVENEVVPDLCGMKEVRDRIVYQILEHNVEKMLRLLLYSVQNVIFGPFQLSDVKSLIQAWVASCAHPENEDADIMGGYFTRLITFHDLEKLDCLIKYLYR